MGRPYLVIDIETVPDEGLYEPAGLAPGEDDFPPLHAHRIVTIGAIWMEMGTAPPDDDEATAGPLDRKGGAHRISKPWTFGHTAEEADVLGEFASFMERKQLTLVTFNGRGFDLPVIMFRCLRHGISAPWYFRGKFRHRYSDEGHIDLCDELSDHGASRRTSLDYAARLIGLPGKLGIDGSQVAGLFQEGRLADIRNYCLSDVAQTALLLLRWKLLQGSLSPADYRGGVRGILKVIDADPQFLDFAKAIDRHRLLLEASGQTSLP